MTVGFIIGGLESRLPFSIVHDEVFKLISLCIVPEEAWEILETAYGSPENSSQKASCEDKGEEDLVESMSLLAKKFNKTLKRFNKKPYSGSGGNNAGVNDKGLKNSKFGGSSNGFKQQNQGKGIQCWDCEDFGHIQKNQELMKRVEEQRVEICNLEEKIQGMIKGIKMMNSSTAVLDEILLQGKRSGDNIGIGFSGRSSKKGRTSPTRVWVAAGTKPKSNPERKFN
ncbi:hypothetical protein LIER_03581 [Lithospermum erythrorhizon]|uniref:Gag-pol polyprotein n=1 Tax=Lithospermum erythrorhizon TaxID=34254 RepID=A0AAV3NUZ3_LITER